MNIVRFCIETLAILVRPDLHDKEEGDDCRRENWEGVVAKLLEVVKERREVAIGATERDDESDEEPAECLNEESTILLEAADMMASSASNWR